MPYRKPELRQSQGISRCTRCSPSSPRDRPEARPPKAQPQAAVRNDCSTRSSTEPQGSQGFVIISEARPWTMAHSCIPVDSGVGFGRENAGLDALVDRLEHQAEAPVAEEDLVHALRRPDDHKRHPVVLGLGPREAYVGPAQGDEALERVLRLGVGRLQRHREGLENVGTNGVEEVVLVLEVQVDRRGGDAHALRNGPDRDGVLVARLGQQFPGCGQDLAPQGLSLAAPGLCRRELELWDTDIEHGPRSGCGRRANVVPTNWPCRLGA